MTNRPPVLKPVAGSRPRLALGDAFHRVGAGTRAIPLPERIRRLVVAEELNSERLIGWVQLAVVVTFASLYAIAPRPADAGMVMLQPVPIALGLYFVFTLARIALARRDRLPGWFVYLSMLVDTAMLFGLIWSFHLQYSQPPAFYLKVPTFTYIFVFIALRALRFDPRFVLTQGVIAALGWLAMALYAIEASAPGTVTRSFTTYLSGNAILIGAEFDKVFVILTVTAILALALARAQSTLITAIRESSATRDMRRFLSEGVADVITSAEAELSAGQAVERDAAILMLDVRGFTPFATSVSPHKVVEALTLYHALAVPIVERHGGVIDKFLGDGVMATFGAVAPSERAAVDAVAALEEILAAVPHWHAALCERGVDEALQINGAVSAGRIVFATLGNAERLEYTVIGEPANLAAKLEKHNKAEGSLGLIDATTYKAALEQGYRPSRPVRLLDQRAIDGTMGRTDLVAFDA
ncbi:adenylate/guanylate cyclase domain-containing protein [Amorphus sp. 3PC139-8]|uniref:adenylate/guanylate cyclase domain-containing protein n=1 Tax=Amorphus sp. 3PC139-8 TaxID=2735676 RepID=UPI00345DFD18